MPRRIRQGPETPPAPCANDLLLPEEIEDGQLRADAEEFVRAAHDALVEVTRGTLYDLSNQPWETMPEVLREFQVRARMLMLRDLSRLASVYYWCDREGTRADRTRYWDMPGARQDLYADVVERFARRADPPVTIETPDEPSSEE